MGLPGIQINGDNTNEFIRGTRRDDVIAGSGGVDIIRDGMGDDTVNAGTGDDIVHVDLGNDFYFGGAGIDWLSFRVIDGGIEGTGEVATVGVTFDLAKIGLQNLGYLGWDTLYGFENVVGSEVNDILYGDAGVNTLSGDFGNDRLDGRAGNDRLEGSLGVDVITGGAGADALSGVEFMPGNDVERDTFRYVATSDSGVTAATRDTIWDLTRGAAATADRIDLSAIDANPFLAGNQAFKFIGTAAFTRAQVGEVRLLQSGAHTFIQVDADRDNAIEMSILVRDVVGLARVDFIL